MQSRSLVALACVVCLTSGSIHALDLSSVIDDYRITAWTGGDGITLGEVRSIAQDRDGYLWLASDAGLVRFDGLRFVRTGLVSGPIQLPMAPTRAVYLARDGSLWVGYGEGRGLYRIEHGEVREVQLAHVLPSLVNVITEDRSGAMWVGHDHGLSRFHNGRWTTSPLPAEGQDRRVFDVHEDRHGAIWVAAASGLYRADTAGALALAPHSRGLARVIAEDQAGRVWTTDTETGFRRADTADRNPLFEARGMHVFPDSRGNLWVTTIGQGLWQVRNSPDAGAPAAVRRATAQTGLVSDESSRVFEDRDGNIWVGSIQGLNRLTPHKATSIVDVGVVRALAIGVDGTGWIGTTSGLVELTGVTLGSPGRRRVIASTPIRALHTASDGTVWAATNDGLSTIVRGRLIPAGISGPPLRRISSIVSDSGGRLWVCDEQFGVGRIERRRLSLVASATDGVSEPPLFAHVGREDRLWIAFKGGTVRRLDPDGHVTHYGSGDGLTHTTINAIHQDRLGELWIGGDGGISRLRGDRFQTVAIQNDAPQFRSVSSVIADSSGDLWVGVAFFGFLRVARDDIDRATSDASARLRYRLYDTSFGAGYPDSAHSGSAARGDSLWFVTSRGVTILEPATLRRDDGRESDGPRIEGITADERRFSAEPGATLPPRISRLRIDYTLVSLSSVDRTHFRYRLDGFDTDWVDGTGPRQAFYTNLPPRDYRFRLQASTNAVDWEDSEAVWAFAIEPMFYQTGWFYASGAVALALAGVAAWRLRVRHVRKELAIVFGERLRVSREIHDTLLQSLFGIALQVDVVSADARDHPSPLRTHLQRIRQQIEDTMSEARQSIWNLRSGAIDRRDLVAALCESGQRLTAGRVPFVMTVTGTPRSCSSDVETQMLRIGCEAVANAVRHADAGRVDMEIGFGEGTLSLRVTDNGRGFNPAPDRTGHYGLLGMKERATNAGGHCTIQSVPGSGVQVAAEFPLSAIDDVRKAG